MQQTTSYAAFLPAFADYVYQQRDAIGHEWMGIVRASPDMPDALHISQEALQDHVPELIGDLVEHLRLEKKGPEAGATDHSRNHGRDQWKAGYNISELIWKSTSSNGS